MILFINGCMRENSRTLELAKTVLSTLDGEVEEVRLCSENNMGLTPEKLALRDRLHAEKAYEHPMFRLARQFADADTIVVAAPYWDLMFPAVVRAYFEEVTVTGITFKYSDEGIPLGLCKAKKLIYVTTSGGPIFQNFGFDYIDALARNLYGIAETELVKAEGLDIWGADPVAILNTAKEEFLSR